MQSRAAAVNELVGENIAGCERDYKIGIYMLEAILEDEEQVMEEDDRRIINKCKYRVMNNMHDEKEILIEEVVRPVC